MANTDYANQHPRYLGPLFKWLRIFWVAYILGEILLILGTAIVWTTGESNMDNDGPFTMGDIFLTFGGLLILSVFLCMVYYCLFSFRAAKNLKIFGDKGMEMAPGWTVGWHFIPFANLWKPYQAMDQIYTTSHSPNDPYASPPPTMPIWWFFWIATNVASNISFRMTLDGESMVGNPMLLAVDLTSSVTGLAAALLIFPILKKITMAQDARVAAHAFD